MSTESCLKVVLCWHMHQPEYRNTHDGIYHLPWTYLHAIKDYTDMAAHLEAVPEARAVVNFVPILLEQIDDYVEQIENYLNKNIALRDPLLTALVADTQPTDTTQRLAIIKNCQRAHKDRQIKRFPAYAQLVEQALWIEAHPDSMRYINDQYIHDLVVWYHLSWMGETIRRNDLRIRRLLEKEYNYSSHKRRELLVIIHELLANIIERYRNLVKRGQVELSVSPYAHPIMPLLLDLKSTHEAMPEAPLPQITSYPGGKARAHWHMHKGIEVFEEHFGFKPMGCWPSEGSVSEETLHLLNKFGLRWTASGEGVLRSSLELSDMPDHAESESPLHRPYRLEDTSIDCFFRDDGLSDLIGFTYSDWHADDAVANLIQHLESIHTKCHAQPDTVVSIILDGENAWEHYPENGYYFLSALYNKLAAHPKLELTTFSNYLEARQQSYTLPHLVAGSWVYGTFSTWIGDRDKNRGWELLANAKQCFDEVMSTATFDPAHKEKLKRQLAICEGSDWFWWFGDYNPQTTVSDFEQLYRLHLSNLYHLLNKEPPDELKHTFTHGKGTPTMGGVMRPGQAS